MQKPPRERGHAEAIGDALNKGRLIGESALSLVTQSANSDHRWK